MSSPSLPGSGSSTPGSPPPGLFASLQPSTYSPAELAAIVLDFYSFLTTLHYDPADLDTPPPEGWPNLTREHCGGLKSDKAIEVLRRLPYFKSTHEANVHYKSALIDYTSIESDYFESDEWKLEDEEYWSNEGEADPEDLFLIAEGHESGGRNLILNVEEGEIIEDMINYSIVGSYDIRSYFDGLKDAYRTLKLIPCVGRVTIEAWKVGERDGMISEEEYHAQETTRSWGTDLDVQFIRQIYRQHGWPHAFRKDDARNAVDDLMASLETAGRHGWEEVM